MKGHHIMPGKGEGGQTILTPAADADTLQHELGHIRLTEHPLTTCSSRYFLRSGADDSMTA